MGTSADSEGMHRIIMGSRSGLVFFVAGMQMFPGILVVTRIPGKFHPGV